MPVDHCKYDNQGLLQDCILSSEAARLSKAHTIIVQLSTTSPGAVVERLSKLLMTNAFAYVYLRSNVQRVSNPMHSRVFVLTRSRVSIGVLYSYRYLSDAKSLLLLHSVERATFASTDIRIFRYLGILGDS
jgi:hypothetical protein